MDAIEDKYNKLLLDYNELLLENKELKLTLQKHGILYKKEDTLSKQKFIAVNLTPSEKISLFRSYFKGRDDVFARRWFSRTTQKSGYSPICINEWRRGICDKKRYKCSQCPNRCFAPLTDQDFYRHLEGKDINCCDVLGLYAILPNDNCYFLCTDFDDKNCTHGYKDDVLAFTKICKSWDIPYCIERSRSGNGAHVWIFFENSLPAYKARKLGNIILNEASNINARLNFKSYDRFFPNQDKLPEGGLGNLVALPLQGMARKSGNSVFVDDNFLPYKDQWSYLYQLRKVSEDFVDSVLEKHLKDDLGALSTTCESKPWETPAPLKITHDDFKCKLKLIMADRIYIPILSVSNKVLNYLKRIASFRNPEFYKKRAMRLSTFNIPSIICRADFLDDYLAIPRGCKNALYSMLDSLNIDYEIADYTNHGNDITVLFKGQERGDQLDAINALMPYSNGVLSATTAFGKTITAAALIARRKVNTLILVHSKALLLQWHERLSEFLDIDFIEPLNSKKRGRKKVFSPIGCLDSTSNTLHGVIDIALMQSCLDNGEVKSFVQDYGMVIVDECHHVSSITFESVLKHVKAHYVYGLTATPIRKDGLQPIIFMQCGPIRFLADAKAQIQKQTFKRLLVPRFTSYRPLTDDKPSFAELLKLLSESEIRNTLIVDDVVKASLAGRTPIILTSRTSHVKLLCNMLEPNIDTVIELTGQGTTKHKRETLQKLQNIPKDTPLVIVATGKYVGEGFDFPRLDTLFLALPISWKGLVAQYAGRLHREIEGKSDVRIYDYIDIHEPICERMYQKRLKSYVAIGYSVFSKSAYDLFGFTEEFDLSTYEGQLFNGSTYLNPLAKDLNNAKQSVVIFSPRLHHIERNVFVNSLIDLKAQGIEIAVLTSCANFQSDYLKNQGLFIKIVPKMSLCACIIDRSCVWYGSVNILGYTTDEDSIMKILDIKIASELLNVIYDSK